MAGGLVPLVVWTVHNAVIDVRDILWTLALPASRQQRLHRNSSRAARAPSGGGGRPVRPEAAMDSSPLPCGVLKRTTRSAIAAAARNKWSAFCRNSRDGAANYTDGRRSFSVTFHLCAPHLVTHIFPNRHSTSATTRALFSTTGTSSVSRTSTMC